MCDLNYSNYCLFFPFLTNCYHHLVNPSIFAAINFSILPILDNFRLIYFLHITLPSICFHGKSHQTQHHAKITMFMVNNKQYVTDCKRVSALDQPTAIVTNLWSFNPRKFTWNIVTFAQQFNPRSPKMLTFHDFITYVHNQPRGFREEVWKSWWQMMMDPANPKNSPEVFGSGKLKSETFWIFTISYTLWKITDVVL